MLGKLIKYEFKSTVRTFMAVYAVLLGFALLTRFSLAASESAMLSGNRFVEMLFAMSVMGYVMVLLSSLVVTFVIIVQRFFKNLTGDEGYLMHTLPASTHSLLQAKLITTFVWEFTTIAVVILSLFVMLFQPWFIIELGEAWGEIGELLRFAIGEIGAGRFFGIIGIMLGAMVIGALTATLMIYAAISIGHTFKKHRVLGSVIAYIGLMMLTQMISGMTISTGIFMNITVMDALTSPLQIFDFVLGTMGVALLLELGFGCAWYFVTHYVLSSQLNLE